MPRTPQYFIPRKFRENSHTVGSGLRLFKCKVKNTSTILSNLSQGRILVPRTSSSDESIAAASSSLGAPDPLSFLPTRGPYTPGPYAYASLREQVDVILRVRQGIVADPFFRSRHSAPRDSNHGGHDYIARFIRTRGYHILRQTTVDKKSATVYSHIAILVYPGIA